MIALVRSLLFAIVFYGGSVVAVLLATLFPGGPAGVRRHAVRWARFHGWCARTLLGIRSRVEGTLPTGPVLVAAKHQSMYETIELLRLLGEPAVVVKRELAEIPGWGRIARLYGVIPVHREGSAKALRLMLTNGRRAIGEGRPVLLFPEGTRVKPGEQPPLRSGFAGLYRALALPVVPIAIDSGLVWPRGLIKHSGTITFRVGEAIEPGLPRQQAEARVHAAINMLERSG